MTVGRIFQKLTRSCKFENRNNKKGGFFVLKFFFKKERKQGQLLSLNDDFRFFKLSSNTNKELSSFFNRFSNTPLFVLSKSSSKNLRLRY